MRKTYIYIGLGSVVTVALYVVINNMRKKKILKKIDAILEKGTQQTGTAKDIKANSAFSPSFYKTSGGKKLTSRKVEEYAKTIYDAIGTFYDDENKIISLIQTIGTKTKMSQVSEKFAIIYGKGLGAFLVSHIDKGNNLGEIQTMIKQMPI